jgi:RNA polymerase sigma factor (sigma-70 family)
MSPGTQTIQAWIDELVAINRNLTDPAARIAAATARLEETQQQCREANGAGRAEAEKVCAAASLDHAEALKAWQEAKKPRDAIFEQLLEGAFSRLRRIAKRRFPDHDRVHRFVETDDILQIASERLWQALDDYRLDRIPASAAGFFRLFATIVGHVVTDQGRHFSNRPDPGVNPRTDQPAPSPDGPLSWAELLEVVERKLTPEVAAVVRMRLFGWSPGEIASALGCSGKTVTRRWTEGLRALRQYLGAEAFKD